MDEWVQEEGQRKLSDYLALPPTQYSLLDPNMITRLTEDTFRWVWVRRVSFGF